MLQNIKTYEQITQETEERLLELNINNNPGGIARLFLNIVNREIADLYETLSLNHANAFLSTATNSALDAIGTMLNCHRGLDESDDDYRDRISKQCLSLATANQTAIRLATLSVDGVVDVVLKPYVYGAGSFSLLVLIDAYNAAEDIMQRVRDAVEPIIGYGIKYEIIQPILKPVSLSLKLILKETVDTIQAQDIKYEVREAVRSYLLTRTIAEEITIAELTQRVMDVNQGISSFICEDMKINGVRVSFINQACGWNERFTTSSDPEAIIIK